VTTPSDTYNITGLHLLSGEARRIEEAVTIEPFVLSNETYAVSPQPVPVKLDVSRMTGQGYALRLRFSATLSGPCMRCLADAEASFEVDSREVEDAGSEDPELRSPYMDDGDLDLGAWARDALALTLPAALLCQPGCAGICPECGVRLDQAGPEHHHERPPDRRWDALRELNLDA
jgi:uncharacterized protein